MLSSYRIRGSTRFGKALNLIFLKHAWLQSRNDFPVSTLSTRNTWHNGLLFVTPKTDWKFGGLLPEKLGGCVACFLKPLPYFRPKSVIFSAFFQTWSKVWYPISALIKKFDTLFQTWSPRAWRGAERMTSFYGTYTVVCVNIKREMVLSPNDEEVANSSKKHTQFNTRRHKPYPVSDQNSRNWYPVSNQKG